MNRKKCDMERPDGLVEFKEYARRHKEAEVAFTRIFEGREYKIYACLNKHGSWEQWGAPTEVLCDNTRDVERWAYKRLTGEI